MNTVSSLKKVVAVDDIPENLLVLKAIFAEAEWELITAVNGLDAMEKIKKHNPDIVVTDTNMPEACGIDLIKSIRKAFLDLPIIIYFSGCNQFPEIKKNDLLELGANIVLEKPYTAFQLIPICTDLLS